MKSGVSSQRIDELLATLCTHCGRQWMKPSAPRGFVEWLSAKFWFHRFRCRACLRRSFRFCPPWNEALNLELRQASMHAARRAAAVEAAAISALVAGAAEHHATPTRSPGRRTFKQAA